MLALRTIMRGAGMIFLYIGLVVVSSGLFLIAGTALLGKAIYGGGTWRGTTAYSLIAGVSAAVALLTSSGIDLDPDRAAYSIQELYLPITYEGEAIRSETEYSLEDLIGKFRNELTYSDMEEIHINEIIQYDHSDTKEEVLFGGIGGSLINIPGGSVINDPKLPLPGKGPVVSGEIPDAPLPPLAIETFFPSGSSSNTSGASGGKFGNAARLSYKVPETMRYGKAARAELVLMPDSLGLDLTAIFSKASEGVASPPELVQLADRMRATLSGVDFEISPVGEELVTVTVDKPHRWDWWVKPKSFGANKVLDLKLYVIGYDTLLAKEKAPAQVESYTKEISVSVSWLSWVIFKADELAPLLKYGLGAAVIGVFTAGGAWVRRQISKPEEKVFGFQAGR